MEARVYIKARREALGLTQNQLADQIGVTQTAVNYWETGKRIPRGENLLQLARILHSSLDELLLPTQNSG